MILNCGLLQYLSIFKDSLFLSTVICYIQLQYVAIALLFFFRFLFPAKDVLFYFWLTLHPLGNTKGSNGYICMLNVTCLCVTKCKETKQPTFALYGMCIVNRVSASSTSQTAYRVLLCLVLKFIFFHHFGTEFMRNLFYGVVIYFLSKVRGHITVS